MTVHRDADALRALRERLGPPPPIGTDYPDGPEHSIPDTPEACLKAPQRYDVEGIDSWLWSQARDVPPLRDPRAYVDPAREPWMAWAPGEVVEAPDADPTLTAAENEQVGAVDRECKVQYCRSSADVTMMGGTTSGVVYPLAICEVARQFRLRNVGGASAGALTAGMAAAAEVGRSRAGLADVRTPQQVADGHVRPSFAGLADVVAWLCQVDDHEPAEAFRLARMFQPSGPARRLWAVIGAIMRKEPAPRAVVAVVRAGGDGATVAVAVWVLLVSLAVAAVRGGLTPGRALTTLLAVASAAAALMGLVLVARRLAPARKSTAIEEPDPVEPGEGQRKGLSAVVGPVLVLFAGAVALVAGQVVGGINAIAALLGALALTLLVAATIVMVFLPIIGRAKHHAYGLVPGAETADGTVSDGDRPLLTWMSDTLDELAGLPAGTVLRFGHLWMGPDFEPDKADRPEAERRALEAAARRPRLRRVNLELVTSEVVQNRAYRFPLPTHEELRARDGSELYLSMADLEASDRRVVPAAVRAVLAKGAAPQGTSYDIRRNKEVRLVRLPQPWDMPVILAMRMSMSFPGLFQAVRMYRRVSSASVRDEFGRSLLHRDGRRALQYPERTDREAAAGVPAGERTQWCEQLWFTDGGVTSNFPIHFFDLPLPLWPTFGINLGKHPPGYGSQDVWVPQDWDGKVAPTNDLAEGMGAFLGAALNTARGWRDTEQTFMPGCRGRVASVRQRPDEGGTNLYMPNATIASLALRGIIAGARLRRRFADDTYWRRNQWIRMRAAMANLEELATQIRHASTLPPYSEFADVADRGGALRTLMAMKVPPDPLAADDPARLAPWYAPPTPTHAASAGAPTQPDFWDTVQAVFKQFVAVRGDVLNGDVPQPHPSLRQVPPV